MGAGQVVVRVVVRAVVVALGTEVEDCGAQGEECLHCAQVCRAQAQKRLAVDTKTKTQVSKQRLHASVVGGLAAGGAAGLAAFVAAGPGACGGAAQSLNL